MDTPVTAISNSVSVTSTGVKTVPIIIAAFIGTVIQMYITIYLYTIYSPQTGPCSCSQGTMLTALLSLSVASLFFSTLLPFTGTVGEIFNFLISCAFLVTAIIYIRDMESCVCIQPESTSHKVFTAVIYIRAALLVLGMVISFGVVLATKTMSR